MTTRRAKPQPPTARRTVDHVAEACDYAATLGHTPCRVGRTVDCWLCSRDGVVGPDGARLGSIFQEKCK